MEERSITLKEVKGVLPSPAGPPGPPGRGDSLNVAGPVTLQLIMGTLLADGRGGGRVRGPAWLWPWSGKAASSGPGRRFFDLVPEDPVVCRPSWSPGGVLVLDDVHPLRNR